MWIFRPSLVNPLSLCDLLDTVLQEACLVDPSEGALITDALRESTLLYNKCCFLSKGKWYMLNKPCHRIKASCFVVDNSIILVGG